MEQRPLRLGDLVDDYCPRERRVTNHAIVAIVNDSIRQTRCTACDVEHVFKGGKPPRRRTRSDAGDEPVDNSGGQLVAPVILSAADDTANGHEERPAADQAEPAPVTTAHDARSDAEAAPPEESEDERPVSDADNSTWHGHRPLIRAQLPRSESDVPPPRPIPEFTIYQRHNSRGGGGGGGFRQARGWGERNGNTANGNGNGNGFGYGGNGGRGDRRSGPGFGGPSPGPGQGQGRRRHGKKRPR